MTNCRVPVAGRLGVTVCWVVVVAVVDVPPETVVVELPAKFIPGERGKSTSRVDSPLEVVSPAAAVVGFGRAKGSALA